MVNHKEIIEYKIANPDASSRQVAKVIGCSKSTVNKVWAAYQEGVETPEDTVDKELEEQCLSEDTNLANLAKRLRTAHRTNTQLRRVINGHNDNRTIFDALNTAVGKASLSIEKKGSRVPLSLPTTGKDNATLEVLLSDLQIGKVSRHYNTEVAKKALAVYGKGVLDFIMARKESYKFERIVIALVGDLVEDHLKHGVGSSVACDTGLAEQMQDAIEGIWEHVIDPLTSLGIETEVVCVTGNHGSSMHKGMDSFKAGRFSYDYVIHNTLRKFCELRGKENVKFTIPDGTFGTTSIYGKHVIYEHGYHNPCSEKGMTDQMLKRGRQLKIHPTYWRQGDKHHHNCFGQGELILNAALFGIEQEGIEYSGILGFNSVPSQTLVVHVEDNRLGRGNVKEVFNVQVTPEDA